MDKPLAGIKVLDFSTFVAAPTCARLLADMGAEVIKVEHPDGDNWRTTAISYIPARFSEDENPVFDMYNAGKKHIALNLKTSEGSEIFHKLLAQSDVLVTNTRPAALKRLGISYEDLKDRYPSLVYAAVLGYGENGPDAEKPAFDTTAFWARSGFLRDMAIITKDYHPLSPPFGVGDVFTGVLLMGEICAALLRREKTGKGDYVRSGLFHNGIFSMGIMNTITQKPFGRVYPKVRYDHGAPGGIYQCKDNEWVFLASSYGPKMYPAMYKAMGIEWVETDERFSTSAGRIANMEAYFGVFKERFLEKTSTEWLEIFEAADIPLGPLKHFSDVSEDEQAWANGYLEHVTFANGRTDVVPSSPIDMDSVGELKTVPAPRQYAHTAQILKELGYTDEQIEELCASGAIRKDA